MTEITQVVTYKNTVFVENDSFFLDFVAQIVSLVLTDTI